jgi:four helix bundle protein
MSIKTYKDLNVFREAYQTALDVSRVSRKFPAHEQFEIGRQLRRSARSIPANIVEGWAKRASTGEFRRYLQISIGSCEESKFWAELSRDEGYLSPEKCDEIENRFNVIGAMLLSLWRNWKNFSK